MSERHHKHQLPEYEKAPVAKPIVNDIGDVSSRALSELSTYFGLMETQAGVAPQPASMTSGLKLSSELVASDTYRVLVQNSFDYPAPVAGDHLDTAGVFPMSLQQDSDLLIPGTTTQFKLSAMCLTGNPGPPPTTFTVALYPIVAVGNSFALTPDAPISGSEVLFTDPPLMTMSPLESSGDFEFSQTGLYAVGFNVPINIAAAWIGFAYRLTYKNV